ncbi:potassium-transporting ATPase subunit KdpA, partial [Staphylococcus pseudintermedius]|uniref:potassium-transporting ATPase subunit KdpA n=1 Tax=Staphylococcus pseudintermedius TaxID=283734 RepID=UPI0021629D54
FLITFSLCAFLLCRYVYSLAILTPTPADKVFSGVEKGIYKVLGAQLGHMSGRTYRKHVLLFNGLLGALTVVLLLISQCCFLYPNHNLNQSV